MAATSPAANPVSASAAEAALTALGDAVRAALGAVPVVDTIPDDTTAAVALMPLSLTRAGRVQQGDMTVEMRLRVLTVTAGPSPLADLETLLIALDHVPRLEVEREEPPLELWSLLGVRPRPAAIVRLDIPVTLPSDPAPLVLLPMRVDARLVRVLNGQLIGPNEVSLPFGVVRALAYDREVVADRDGRFRLAIPVDDDHVALIVTVKGRTFTVDATVPLQDQPTVIHCDREET